MASDVHLNMDAMQHARQRMRHLARWHIEPVPMIGLNSRPATDDSLSDEARQRLARLSLQVLAIQMGNAASAGSLER